MKTLPIPHAPVQRAVKRLVTAEVAWSWHGGDHPETWDDTEDELMRSRRLYRGALRTVTSRARAQGYYAAVAALLRKEGRVTPIVREMFAAGIGIEHVDAGDRALFRAAGLIESPSYPSSIVLTDTEG